MRYIGQIWRPPSEAESLILQVSVGCSHNQCTFCIMYKAKEFFIKSLAEIHQEIMEAAKYEPDVRRIFLADGDALRIPTSDLLQILEWLKEYFPRLTRVTTYAGAQSILEKSETELASLRAAGLKIAYLGLESGHDGLLRKVRKGVTPEQMIEAVKRLKSAGIKSSVTVILGLGGQELSVEHAKATAKVVSLMEPDYLSALTLMIAPSAPIQQQIQTGEVHLLTPQQTLQELYLLLEGIEVAKPCIFRSNHASNYLAVGGTLPKDKDKMLAEMDDYLREPDDQLFKAEWLRGL